MSWRLPPMDVADLLGIVTLVVSVGALWFAWRATVISEQTLKHEQHRDKTSNSTTLEFVTLPGRANTWRFTGRTHERTAWFVTEVRNRGPAHALDLTWSASIGSERARLRNTPDRLQAFFDEQEIGIEVPLEPDRAPTQEVIRINLGVTEGDGRKQYQWCLQFSGERTGATNEWTLQDLDCISLKPRSETWAQPLPNR